MQIPTRAIGATHAFAERHFTPESERVPDEKNKDICLNCKEICKKGKCKKLKTREC